MARTARRTPAEQRVVLAVNKIAPDKLVELAIATLKMVERNDLGPRKNRLALLAVVLVAERLLSSL